MLPLACASGARACRRSTAGSLWRINAAAQLQPRFLGSASSGVTRIFPCPSPASSSQAGPKCRPGGVRSRPGAGVNPPAGTALAPSVGRHRLTPFEERDSANITDTVTDVKGMSLKKRRCKTSQANSFKPSSVVFGAKRTSFGRQNRPGRSKMTLVRPNTSSSMLQSMMPGFSTYRRQVW